jgi:hypothetical protein
MVEYSKNNAPNVSPQEHFSKMDPQEYGGLRQGSIALIHSAPTEERLMIINVGSASLAGDQCPG